MPITVLGEYLKRPSIDPRVCNQQRTSLQLVTISAKKAREWLSAFVGDRTPKKRWQWCTRELLASLPPPEAVLLLDAMIFTRHNLIKKSDFGLNDSMQEKVAILEQLYITRRGGLEPHKEVEDALMDDLRNAVNGFGMGFTARTMARLILYDYDLRRMIWHGSKLSIDIINRLARDKNEHELERIMGSVPDRAIRDEAKRRIIRLRMERSPYPELLNIAQTVEQRVFYHSTFPLSFDDYPVINAWFDTNFKAPRGVLVRQAPNDGPPKISLHLFESRDGQRHVESKNTLTGALQIAVQGVSRPVTLCPSVNTPDTLDPTPCVSPKDVVVENPLAKLNSDGTLSLAERISEVQFRQILRSRDGLVIPISIGEKRLKPLSWRVYIESPENVVFTEERTGLAGPRLWVFIDHRDPSRFLITVMSEGRTRRIVLDLAEAAGFQLISRGAVGMRGLPGERGSACGESPGRGGNGFKGGNGGKITVQVACNTDASCFHTIFLAQNMIRSLGGSGGEGGVGGVSIVCSDNDYSDGPRGPSGDAGPNGDPGPVKFDVLAPGQVPTYED